MDGKMKFAEIVGNDKSGMKHQTKRRMLDNVLLLHFFFSIFLCNSVDVVVILSRNGLFLSFPC